MRSRNSRYVDTEVLKYEDTKYLDLWKRPTEFNNIKDTLRYKEHTVIESEIGCLDMLALRYYMNERLFWVIALFNNIIDPVSDMYAGQVLRIPDKLFVTAFLTRS